MRLRWFLTVLLVMNSCSAISRLVLPRASRLSYLALALNIVIPTGALVRSPGAGTM
jgi:hypothetical protein